jgi:hypothetical protein
MKKQQMILPTMLLVSVLSACGGNGITQQQAVDAAKKIKAYHESDSFAYKQDKVTFSLNQTTNEGTQVGEMRVQKDTYLYTSTVSNVAATSTSSASSATEKIYLFSKDSKYYYATDNGTTKSYQVLSLAAFTLAITASEKTVYGVIDTMAEGAYSSLSDFIKENDTSSSSSASVTSSLAATSSASSASKIKTTYSYASTGDGNLSLTANSSEDDSEAKISGTGTFAFDAYYPVSLKEDASGTQYSASSAVAYTSKLDLEFSWDKCDQILPDLTTFSVQA